MHAYITKGLTYKASYPKRDSIRGETYKVVNADALKFLFIFFYFGTTNMSKRTEV